MATIIAYGAEAILVKDGDKLIKNRIKKGYRIIELDNKLRKARTRHEITLLREARRSGVATPHIFEEDETTIKMEFINGIKVKDILDRNNFEDICKKISESISRLHNNNIIHGDLTTSNMILYGEKIYFIDFGLGFRSQRVEDKANDLYLLHEALESTHFEILEKAWKTILKAYKDSCHEAKKVLNTLSEIEKRGRYKER